MNNYVYILKARLSCTEK